MSAGAGVGKLAVLLKERDFAVHHGVLFVIAFGLLGAWAPTLVVVYPEYLVGGLFAGFVLGSVAEGLISTFVGGSVMALGWVVAIGATGDVGLAVVSAFLVFANAVVGGLVGGLVGSTLD